MTKQQLLRICSLWRKRLGLESWDLSIDFENPCGEHANATIWRANTYDRAVLYPSAEWRQWTELEATRHIVHELLHLMARDLEEAFKSMESRLSKTAFAMANERFEFEIEGLIDRVSYSLVQ